MLSDSMFENRNQMLLTLLEGYLAKTHAQSVHVFLPIAGNNEPNILPLLSILWQRNVRIISSVTDFKKKEMKHFFIDKTTKLIENNRGIPEPLHAVEAHVDEIDAILVPLLLADKQGNRVGYGGGYYDRLLKKTKAIKIGLSLSYPLDEIVQTDPWDVPLNLLITPFKIYYHG